MNLIVTGTLVPDATGLFVEAGVYGGYPYYRRGDGAWFIWSSGQGWYIGSSLGSMPDARWWNQETNPVGIYQPYNGGEGIATAVSAGGEIVIGTVDYLRELIYGHNNNLACI